MIYLSRKEMFLYCYSRDMRSKSVCKLSGMGIFEACL